jgi:diguanylate cyclase (GGDEF)-like protein/putative nucleotidyltransferase with HDIG domain
MIVYGLFLVIVGVTATAQTLLVSLHFSTASLEAIVGSDAATIRTFANGFLQPTDLSGTVPASRTEAVESTLAALLHRGELLRIDVRRPDGTILYTTDPSARGAVAPMSSGFAKAIGTSGTPTVDAAVLDGTEDVEAPGAALASSKLVRGYFPLVGADGRAGAVMAIFRDATPLFAKLNDMRTQVVIVTLSAAAIVAVLLFLIFRAAQRRITDQTTQLVESTRRDALTGLLNHGALVGELAVAIEEARRVDAAIGVALIDIDNFRLLNDTYGHPAGDAALTRVAMKLERSLPATATLGRSGPDEFLIVVPGRDVVALEVLVEAVRIELADDSLQFGASERLPLTISGGIAVFPEHASSVTELLSLVAVVLNEAKASGGDAVRTASARVEASESDRTFDVLQGLIIAVDTKDRYTKRHSEDVARYGVFLARELGLDASFHATVRTAGLLHDIGKIGIPDAVLRKPGHLTGEEYEIVKQHVALGDSIVRNVDDIEHVRAGIRHHHERWDGRGYLHALRGEDIPLIARILAVGDAFSAMTTTRPYRKALSVEEALRRLGDAAGTQLDERLVAAFIRGIETAADAPLPGQPSTSPLWVPRTEVA